MVTVPLAKIAPPSSKLNPHDLTAAEQRLNLVIGPGKPWHPDLIYKLFDDLDRVLFAGTLQGGVNIRWEKQKAKRRYREGSLFSSGGDSSSTSCLGIVQAKTHFRGIEHWRQASITLFARETFQGNEYPDPFKVMFATLVHEMVVCTF